MNPFTVVRSIVQQAISALWIFKFVSRVDEKIDSDSRSQVCSPEIGAAMYRVVGFLNYDKIKHRIGPNFAAGKRPDEVHRFHAKLRHFFDETL
jgi:hypothetical protein